MPPGSVFSFRFTYEKMINDYVHGSHIFKSPIQRCCWRNTIRFGSLWFKSLRALSYPFSQRKRQELCSHGQSSKLSIANQICWLILSLGSEEDDIIRDTYRFVTHFRKRNSICTIERMHQINFWSYPHLLVCLREMTKWSHVWTIRSYYYQPSYHFVSREVLEKPIAGHAHWPACENNEILYIITDSCLMLRSEFLLTKNLKIRRMLSADITPTVHSWTYFFHDEKEKSRANMIVSSGCHHLPDLLTKTGLLLQHEKYHGTRCCLPCLLTKNHKTRWQEYMGL